jgi:hypothetical protein
MHRTTRALFVLLAIVLIGVEKPSVAAFQTAAAPAANRPGRLIVYGDVTLFLGKPGAPGNCALQSRFKRGDPVGFRMTAFDSETGQREPTAEFVVHLSYGGKTQDVPMRYRGTVKQPEREFWVAKWVVPADAPTGIVRYTVTAKDKYGRTGEFKPFVVEDSQVTIVE